MTSRDFCYWLQGFFEISDGHEKINELSEKQIDLIRKHLSLVFKHEIDLSFKSNDQNKTNEQHQQELKQIHDTIKDAQEGIKQTSSCQQVDYSDLAKNARDRARGGGRFMC